MSSSSGAYFPSLFLSCFSLTGNSADLFVLHCWTELRGWVMVTLYGKVVGVSEVARFFS